MELGWVGIHRNVGGGRDVGPRRLRRGRRSGARHGTEAIRPRGARCAGQASVHPRVGVRRVVTFVGHVGRAVEDGDIYEASQNAEAEEWSAEEEE